MIFRPFLRGMQISIQGSLQKLFQGLCTIDPHPKGNLPANFERNRRHPLAHILWYSQTCPHKPCKRGYESSSSIFVAIVTTKLVTDVFRSHLNIPRAKYHEYCTLWPRLAFCRTGLLCHHFSWLLGNPATSVEVTWHGTLTSLPPGS